MHHDLGQGEPKFEEASNDIHSHTDTDTHPRIKAVKKPKGSGVGREI
jgi:hypothetical protein